MKGNMSPLQRLSYWLLRITSAVYSVIPWKGKGHIAEPGHFLNILLNSAFGNGKLEKLEYMADMYRVEGIFKYEEKIYIVDPKLAQTAINKLDKGAENYLKDSPLKETFLGSSERSPEVRRAIAALFRKSSLEEKADLIVRDVENMCQRMEKEAKQGAAVNLTDWALRMAMDVVGHMLLQLDLHALEGRQGALLDCIMCILHRCYAQGEITPDSKTFRDANAMFESITSKILEAALEKEDTQEEKRFVKKLYEACGFEQARANMKLFLMAGSETTASSIPVLFHLLIDHPQVQEELRQEADENIDALYNDPTLPMPKVEAVMRELLRVYPIAPFISRRTHVPTTLGSVRLEANSDIIVFTWGIHRSPNQWKASKQFEPFRFLHPDRSANNMFIPFGAGSRICIGQHLAWLELKIAITIMLHKFTFEGLPQTPQLYFVVDWQHAVVHPDVDLLLKVTPRNHS